MGSNKRGANTAFERVNEDEKVTVRKKVGYSSRGVGETEEKG